MSHLPPKGNPTCRGLISYVGDRKTESACALCVYTVDRPYVPVVPVITCSVPPGSVRADRSVPRRTAGVQMQGGVWQGSQTAGRSGIIAGIQGILLLHTILKTGRIYHISNINVYLDRQRGATHEHILQTHSS